MASGFLGKGWSFPIISDSTGELNMCRHEEDIKQAIQIILSTSKGERIMRPDFGCGIHDFTFSTVNTSTIALIESSVREALALWEHRISVMSVKAATEEIDDGKLMIHIEYQIRTTNKKYNYVYPFYLTEGE